MIPYIIIAVLAVALIVAMVFSSSMVLLMFSASETQTENNKHRYGTQFAAYTVDVIKEDDFKTAKESGLSSDYGYMHNIGYAYSDENEKFMGAAAIWMDETADRMYYLTLLEGRVTVIIRTTVYRDRYCPYSSLKYSLIRKD